MTGRVGPGALPATLPSVCPRDRLTSALVPACFVAALCSCAVPPRPGDGEAGDAAVGALFAQPVAAAEGGVEWRVLTVHAHPAALDEALTAVAGDPAGAGAAVEALPEPVATLWRGAGVRVLRVPASRLAALQAALVSTATKDEGTVEPISAGSSASAAAALSRMAVEPGPRWVEGLRDAGSGVPRVLALADSRQPLDPGIVRLLTRCWPEPHLTESGEAVAMVRVELLPAWVDAAALRRPRSLDELAAGGPRRGLEEQGVAIQRMHAAVSLASGDALVIAHAGHAPAASAPGAVPSADSGAGLGDVRRGPADGPPAARTAAPVPDESAGPRPPEGVGFAAPTLGDLLFTRAAGARRPGETQAAARADTCVVVLVTPRVPERVSFIGR